ncbi:MAG: glycosyltransferase family 2 protein, partial [Clostridia bacterium]|nr:glycosyltransferase family 2 protein [Clostridia bacterium]
MKTLTVLTPTFNRAELLRRVYSSMIRQTSDDFVWMIVDDGSTDDTERFVREFIEEGKIEIEYIKKENGGKHTAVNLAISSVKTELIAISLDSDDAFLPDSAERILRVYRETGGAYDGYVFPKGSS